MVNRIFVFLIGLLTITSVVAAPTQIDGSVEVIQVDDFLNQVSPRHYWLNSNGERLSLDVGRIPHTVLERLRTHDKIRVSGDRSGKHVSVDNVEMLNGAVSGSTTTAQAVAVSGSRKALLIVVDMLDAKASTRYTAQQLAGLMYDNPQNVAGDHRASSFGQVDFVRDTDGNGTADIAGPVTISFNASGACDYNGWANAADQQVTKAGVNLSLYQHKIYILPYQSQLPNCGWSGLGQVSCGDNCRAWDAAAEYGMVAAHELGHNLGWHHNTTDFNNDGTPDSEYGDLSGIMGNSTWWNQTNAPDRDQFGWYGNYPSQMLSSPGAGSYVLYPLESNPATQSVGAQVIKLRKADTNEYYYVAYRTNTSIYPVYSNYQGKVTVHRYVGSGSTKTGLVAVLGVGQQFADSVNGITVTARDASAGYATVDINQVCVKNAPTASLTPTTVYSKSLAGIAFTGSVSDQDGSGCSASTFSLATQISTTAMMGAVSPASLTLSAGQSGQGAATFDATTTTDGSYQVSLVVSDASGAHATATASSKLVIDNTAPSAPSGLALTIKRKTQRVLNWLAASDSGSGVAGYRVYRNGVLIGSTTSTSYTDGGSMATGTYTYSVTAYDKAGNVSLESNKVSYSK